MQGIQWVRAAAALAVVLAAATAPAMAQRTTFNPEVSLEEAYHNNVSYVGTDATSDSVTRLALLLPVRREWRKASLSLHYRPSIERYQQFDDLNHDSHELALKSDAAVSRRGRLSSQLSASRTQAQGLPTSLESTDLFVAPRSEIDRVQATLGYDVSGGRWTWTSAVTYATSSFEPISGLPPTTAPLPEDRSEYGGSFGVGRTVSPNTSVGVLYGIQRFDLDFEGKETVHLLSITSRHELTRRLSLNAEVGGFYSRRDESTPAAVPPSTEEDETRSGAQARLTLAREFERSELSVTAYHRPSSGGVLGGTSTDSALGVSVRAGAGQGWSWFASLRGAHRDPSIPTEPEVDSLVAGGSIERAVGGVLGLRLGSDYARQFSDDPTVEAKFYSATLGLVWYPLGKTKIARPTR